MKKSDIFWQTYLNLENELLQVAKVVFFTDHYLKLDSKTGIVNQVDYPRQMETFSPYIADLLVRCCVEIESVSKELYFENGGSKIRGSSDLYFDTDCIALLIDKWGIDKKKVIVSSSIFSFKNEENFLLVPLKNAGKRSKTLWSKSYQAVKHDRYNSLRFGNIKALLESMAALFLLNIYYRDIRISTKYLDFRKTDMSFGSSVFSLPLPKEEFIINVVNGAMNGETLVSDESPYVLKYTNDHYKLMKKTISEINERKKEFFMNQPEINDPLFLNYLSSSDDRLDPWTKLYKFRLNKKIPASLPFESRKKLLVENDDWKKFVKENGKRINEKELTEDNIQETIDSFAAYTSLIASVRFENIKIIKGISEGYCEMVLDKGNVKYID